MIPYFPQIYPDELLYSQFARYYTASGYMAYTYAAEELFASKTVRPDMEFINTYTPDALQAITRFQTMEELVLQHTMFPYYGRFLPIERRRTAFQALVSMAGNYHNLLSMPQRRDGKLRYLRYCPRCAVDDREQYGETYWHRVHQMTGLRVCPVHKCYLMDSRVLISGKASPNLVTAEEVIPSFEEWMIATNEIELQIAAYMAKVFLSNVALDSKATAGQFLYSRMENTKYRSTRGQQRNIRLYHADFSAYYKNLSDNRFTELWQLQKVLTDERFNFNEICLMANFLRVSPDDLVRLELPEKSQQQRFDEAIYRLHAQGMKYPEIAKKLNAPYMTVKTIGARKYGTYHKPHKTPLKSGTKPQNWQQIDDDLLPLVRNAVKELKGDGATRPRRVTVFAVEKMLNLTSKKITLYLPKCLAEIRKHEESQEQYWAREVVWAANQIAACGSTLVWRRVRELTNMRRKNFEACVPYLSYYADKGLQDLILQNIGKYGC